MLSLLLAAAVASCSVPPGWDQVAARAARYVVFGEQHGTREAPAFVGQVACALARQKKRVLIAVELGVSGEPANAALQAAWEGPHASFAATLTRTMPDWAMTSQTGVASQAMLDMLTQLHAERAAGRAIEVVAFSGSRNAEQRARFSSISGQGWHEAAMAENIRLAADAGHFDQVLVLVGNLHARKDEAIRGSIRFDRMAKLLAPAEQVTSLNMALSGGSAWNCVLKGDIAPVSGKPITTDMLDCAPHAIGGAATGTGAQRVGFGPSPGKSTTDEGYDGWFWLGEISASPPALESKP